MTQLWPALLALILGIAYTLIVHRKSPSQRWAWLHSAVAILVSVLLGISVALFMFSAQQASLAREQKHRYLSLLTLELSSVHQRLRDDTRVNITCPGGKVYQAQITYIQPVVLEEAGKSGLFNEPDSFMILDLAGSIRMWNIKTPYLFAVMNSNPSDGKYEMKLQWVLTNLDRARSGILNGTSMLSQQLGIELKKNITNYY